MYAPKLSATTVLILERNRAECQIFVLKRQDRGGFLKDALVFPGGIVEKIDFDRSADPVRAAAVREIEEETGLRVDSSDLVPFSWWLTPESEPKRFDTHFFVAPYPKGQEPSINLEESQWGRLMIPSEILEQHARREVRLLPPTLLTLETICGLTSFEEVVKKAQVGPEPICPKVEIDASGQVFLTIPESAGFGRSRKLFTDFPLTGSPK